MLVSQTGWAAPLIDTHARYVPYILLLVAVAGERVVELVVARRNSAWAARRGGVETGQGHYPFMVVLHTGLLLGALLEVTILHRPFLPWLGWPMLALVVAAQALRWWCILTLGPRWNTRIVVVPGLPPITRGPYRWLRHPNYVAVVVEGIALPLVHTAWWTAVVFTVLNAGLLTVRIRQEEAAMARAAGLPGLRAP
nr:isoprenylcysteine carboxyl methyltransferase family protein [Nakamurella leprariae]